jgi:hypothetical protein
MKKAVLLLLLLSSLILAKIDILSINPNSWIVQKDGNSTYYNKLSFDGYFSWGDIKLFASIPLAYTYESSDKNQFGLADIEWYLGRQFGALQPRLGMIIPGIYSLDDSWIGSQDLLLSVGLAVQPHRERYEGLIFSEELSFLPYISKNFGLAQLGSWRINTITKASYLLASGLHFTGELLLNLSSIEWEWTTPARENSLIAVPVLTVSYKFTPVEIGVKGGYGPTFSSTDDYNLEFSSMNLSLGMFADITF